MFRPAPFLLVLSLLAPLAAPRAAGTDERSADEVSAGGSLAWIFSREIDLLGDLRADLPFAVAGGRSLYLSIDALTAIEKATSDFTFTVREVDATLEAGLRSPRPSGRVISAFAGRRSRERVDAGGEPFVTYVGAAVESEGFLRASWSRPLEWRADAAVVVARRDVKATALVRGDVRWLHRARSFAFGADAKVDVLAARGSGLTADVAAGPRIDVDLPGGRRVAFFARYLRARQPLGVQVSGATVGFDYAAGPVPGPAPRPVPPDVSGNVAAGTGGGRSAGRLEILAVSPPFLRRYRAVLDVDANVLTGRDTDELYYLYHLGIERESERRLLGIYAYHRSNHQLAHPSDTITSLNVLEAGVETPRYDRALPRESAARLGILDFRARAGAVMQSTGSAARRWNVRGGVRWSLPGVSRRAVPFVRLEAEEGHVDRRAASAGAAFPSGVAVAAEWRRDDQYFGREKAAWLLTASRAF
jgi:hypothetical protein